MLQTMYMYYVTIRTAININYYVISVLLWFVAVIPMPCMPLCYLLDCTVECYYLATKGWYMYMYVGHYMYATNNLHVLCNNTHCY